jgi:midasin
VSHETSSTFTFTKSVLRNIERILQAVMMKESVLLVGETGTGKTTLVQEICTLKGKKLSVFNVSQSTDSIDLLGGFKPVDLKCLLEPLYVRFIEIL